MFKQANELATAVAEMALAGKDTNELINQAKEVMGTYGQAIKCEMGKGKLLDVVRGK
ncbi:MAG: hypothetical protein N4A57_02600 [Anaeromicrobium sp.]|uniref:hypothetical protein n=1 Tax=Anaeromicrobium sp. TaxID=1929132 RepID=UPI0025D2115B|nr:hypothetical protein [Anaeromicrobium sp.]MCT4593150.1 hypothetical protein [Anaeromicrobium sp.]